MSTDNLRVRTWGDGGMPCRLKRSYRTRKFACAVAAKIRREARENVHAYHCPTCGAYHVGHPPGSQRRAG